MPEAVCKKKVEYSSLGDVMPCRRSFCDVSKYRSAFTFRGKHTQNKLSSRHGVMSQKTKYVAQLWGTANHAKQTQFCI
jgi:alpha-D-ribose 1-methylphosphonate 5-triphosphate diphosphatase PhnM